MSLERTPPSHIHCLPTLRTLALRHDLEREIHMLDPLVNAARAHHIHIVTHIRLHILRRQAAAHLHQRLVAPLLLQLPRADLDAIAREVVEHYDIGARRDRLVRLLERLALNLDLDAEAAGRLGRVHGLRDAALARPDVVVLEHRHRRQVVPVRVAPADQHAVLLDQAEAGGRLARAGQRVAVASGAE